MIRRNDFENAMLKADWKNFQLAIFNIIQNGIKYNQFKGDLIILLKLTKKTRRSQRYKHFCRTGSNLKGKNIAETDKYD